MFWLVIKAYLIEIMLSIYALLRVTFKFKLLNLLDTTAKRQK
jgi:hypothetical protein